jgi:hypothetical protein
MEETLTGPKGGGKSRMIVAESRWRPNQTVAFSLRNSWTFAKLALTDFPLELRSMRGHVDNFSKV